MKKIDGKIYYNKILDNTVKVENLWLSALLSKLKTDGMNISEWLLLLYANTIGFKFYTDKLFNKSEGEMITPIDKGSWQERVSFCLGTYLEHQTYRKMDKLEQELNKTLKLRVLPPIIEVLPALISDCEINTETLPVVIVGNGVENNSFILINPVTIEYQTINLHAIEQSEVHLYKWNAPSYMKANYFTIDDGIKYALRYLGNRWIGSASENQGTKTGMEAYDSLIYYLSDKKYSKTLIGEIKRAFYSHGVYMKRDVLLRMLTECNLVLDDFELKRIENLIIRIKRVWKKLSMIIENDCEADVDIIIDTIKGIRNLEYILSIYMIEYSRKIKIEA